jgi:hypothetical protein
MILLRGGTGRCRMAFLSFSVNFLIYLFRQIFPIHSTQRPVCKNSALARIKEKRAALKAIQVNAGNEP